MPLTRGLGAYDDGTAEAPGAGTTPIDVRKDLAGLFTPSAVGTIGARAGILPTGAWQLVAGAAGENAWRYAVGAFHVVTSRGAADGVQLFANDGLVYVGATGVGSTVPGAPSSGMSRVDIIWVRHPTNSENSDTSSQPVFGVAVGTPGSPGLPPAVPPGALELARNTMTGGPSTTSTSSDGNAIQQTFPWAALRGTPVKVRNADELAVLAPLASLYDPVRAYRIDTGQDLVNYGSGWRVVPSVLPYGTYTPTWGAATSPPNVGTPISGGSIAGRRRLSDLHCDAHIEMIIGSSGAAGGAGEWSWSLPFPAGGGIWQVAHGWINSGTFIRPITGVIVPGESVIRAARDAAGTALAGGYALAAGARVIWNAHYETA